MNIHCIGFNSVYGSNYNVKRTSMKNSYMLILLKSSGVFNLNGANSKAEKDTVIIYDRNTVQEYSSDGNIFICDWVCFDTENESDFFDSLDIPLNTLVKYTDADFFSALIRNIASEFYSVNSKRSKMIDSLLKTLLIKISMTNGLRETTHQNIDPHYSVLTELRNKIYRNPQLKWNVDAMAADVNMSRSYFQHIYREIFGVSCISDVISGKIEKAKEILSETSCTISQVSAMCGYDNEEHFMRQFKKIVGVTPTVYRKKK